MAKNNRVGDAKDEFLRVLPAACADEKTAVELLEGLRWGDAPACPRCGDTEVTQMRGREGSRNARFLWRCRGCKRQFTVRIGTIFEESPIPVRLWLHAFWRMCASKKGISALQLQRELGLGSYRSALFLAHRIRHVMESNPDDPLLSGTVEVDETFVGGKPRFRRRGGQGVSKKTPVMALVSRGGSVRTRVIGTKRVTIATARKAVNELVHPDAEHIFTDENSIYKQLDAPHAAKHQSIPHKAGIYWRDGVSTNTVESFFALFKRGLVGTFHSVSKHHLHRYLDEFEFRYNRRRMTDGERTVAAIRNSEGKRLTYAA